MRYRRRGKAEDAGLTARHLRKASKVFERSCRVVGSLGEIELSHVAERPLQAVGILLLDGRLRG